MARRRDYKTEYARRIARGKVKGLSRSQVRGHPRHHEPYISEIIKARPWNPELEEGLKQIREGESLTRAAKSLHIAPERLRAYLVRTGVARKERARWTIGPDARRREMLIYTRGRELVVILPDYSSAQLAGRYMAAVGSFLDSNDPNSLAEFVGQGVSDVDGQFHPFETRENVLYRLTETQTESFQDVYKIVA